MKTALTTPEAPDLHGLFAMMRERGVEACAMEVSSHALVMGRVDGVVFDVAVFTNLGRDHLDFHADLEDYFAAKASLFTPERARLGLVNVDDEYGRRLVERGRHPRPHLLRRRPGRRLAGGRRRARRRTAHGSWSSGPDGERAEAGVPAARRLQRRQRAGRRGRLRRGRVRRRTGGRPAWPSAAGVPGRFERVDAGQDFLVLVDYAHKPDAVAAAVRTLRPLTDGRVIVVLGAGGDRDPGKRPMMGEIAARLADVFIVTDDNPRSEDPAAIRQASCSTAPPAAAPRCSRSATGAAPSARPCAAPAPATSSLVAGKGHEAGQEIDGVIHPFDDRDVVREELAAR